LATETLVRYFPHLGNHSLEKLGMLEDLYKYWNSRINVISRRDMPNLYINHVLHSLSLAKVIDFSPGETVLDIGTGGGFPGVPLAIVFPDVNFTLVDSTGKKIKVVENIISSLKIKNADALHMRAEDLKSRYNYVVSRAVCAFPQLVRLSKGRLYAGLPSAPSHGIYSLKGGNLEAELSSWEDRVKVYEIAGFFEEEYFKNKKIVFLPSGDIG